MRKLSQTVAIVLTLLLLSIPVMDTMAQSSAVTPIKSVSVTKEICPPIFEVRNFWLEDPSGNNAIDANETCYIILTVCNTGDGDGQGLKGVIKGKGDIQGLTFKSTKISDIKAGQTRDIRFPIRASMDTKDGRAEFVVKLDEPLGFGTDSLYMSVDTRKFVQPLVKIVDYTVTGAESGRLKKMQRFDLQILVQNIEYGNADDVRIDIELPKGVFILDGPSEKHMSHLTPGEAQSIEYTLIVNNDYSAKEIPIKFKLSESYGRFAENRDIVLSIDQQFASKKLEIQSVAAVTPEINIASLRSDVDKYIPDTGKEHKERFAIVIGNEDYHSHQTGLSSESDVPYAVNDAVVFARYCENVLGIPKSNIALLTNARWSDMNREIQRMTELVKLEGDKAELVFYYAGHGFPDENTRESYLIPVDISGADYKSGFKLNDIYSELTSTGARRVTVFMDACFSGGGRQAGLLAARGIKVVPRHSALKGNIVVFSATSGDQVALPYNEKQHGMFTYFLLKKLQETSGNCTYSELSDYLYSTVSEYSLRVNYKKQNPETSYSYDIDGEWENWTVN